MPIVPPIYGQTGGGLTRQQVLALIRENMNQSVRGQLLSTATFKAGNFAARSYASWVLASGISSEVTTTNNGAWTDANLNLPLKPLSNSQTGWFFEFIENGVILKSGIISTLDIPVTTLELPGIANNIDWTLLLSDEDTLLRVMFRSHRRQAVTVPNGSTYQLKVYIAEN